MCFEKKKLLGRSSASDDRIALLERNLRAPSLQDAHDERQNAQIKNRKLPRDSRVKNNLQRCTHSPFPAASIAVLSVTRVT
jgi:hypothetical protein